MTGRLSQASDRLGLALGLASLRGYRVQVYSLSGGRPLDLEGEAVDKGNISEGTAGGRLVG